MNNLMVYRKRARLRQLDIAREIGVSEMAVSKWETGRAIPTPEVMNKLGEILKAKPTELFPEMIGKEAILDF